MQNYTELLPQKLIDMGWSLVGSTGYFRAERFKGTRNQQQTRTGRELVNIIVQAYELSGLREEGRAFWNDWERSKQEVQQLGLFPDTEGGN